MIFRFAVNIAVTTQFRLFASGLLDSAQYRITPESETHEEPIPRIAQSGEVRRMVCFLSLFDLSNIAF